MSSLRLKPGDKKPPFSLSSPSGSSSSSSPSPANEPTPPTAAHSPEMMKVFGSKGLKNDVGIVVCPHCTKPVLKSAMGDHTETCKMIRANGAVKKGAPAMPPPTAAATGSNGSMGPPPEPKKTSPKKRKASEMEAPGEIDSPSPTKKVRAKPAPRVTKGRARGPVDVDRQCGVINDKGLPCSRSLTCKSHAMGAKRAVPGRSKDYDELLKDWYRLHNPNWVEPVKKPTKEEKKAKKEQEKAEKAAAKAAEKAEAAAKALAAGEKPKKGNSKKKKPKVDFVMDVPEEEEEILNPMEQEAEVDALVEAVQSKRRNGYGAQPLAVPQDTYLYFLEKRERVEAATVTLYEALTFSY